MTQLNLVRGHLLKHGNITSWEAITKYRITRLSEYIRQLRHEEMMDITDKWESNKETKWKKYFYKVN